ncbi:MAG: hypothetical protein RBR15_16115 [Sphaerochaeta sp.]|nr:hypothetical protein [Sphaerochaeta sp.]
MQEKQEQPQEKAKEKTKVVLGKGQVAMLSISATVMVFILAFSCYGCSYQPITPPTLEEAKGSFESLYNSTWVLDKAAGVPPTLTEMHNQPVEKFVIDHKQQDKERASTTMHIPGIPPVQAELSYRDEYGFVLTSGAMTFDVKLLYSSSKDGKSETLTMIGNESNTHCYYLKK